MKKLISKKFLSAILALIMLSGLFAAMPMTASAEDDPFQVTENPVGGMYWLNQTAVPLKATFEYNMITGVGIVDIETPIKVQWYWSETNSNTGRINGLGETVVEYDKIISYRATLTHTTAVAGVRYYYAVISYGAVVLGDSQQWEVVPMETATAPAKIEVRAPEPPPEQSFDVIKIDEDGNLLAGAIFSLVPDEEHAWGEKKSYEAISDEDGSAIFTVTAGVYILSEKQAPDGYNASDETYVIWVGEDQILEVVDYNTQNYKPYETIIFVNSKILPPPVQSHIVTALKVDEDGKPLAGATLHIEGVNDKGVPRVYDAITDKNGVATFEVEPGEYILSEYAAPEGYNTTDDKYNIIITSNGVFFNFATHLEPYKPVIFVNKKIPTLNKKDHFAYMQGYPDGTFGPGKNMTRAEAVVMFSRLLAKKMELTTDYRGDYYPDVPKEKWYANEVGYMQLLGVLSDYSRDKNFRPDEPVTRAEFATLAAHFAELTLTDTNIFTDVANDHWAVKYINSAAAKGWIEGYPDKTFKPEANITRAEVVTLVNRILERKADAAYIAANLATLPRSYSDVTNHWAYLAIMEASVGHDFNKEVTGDEWTEKWTAVYK